MEEQQRQFKGIWIPKEIWLNKELTMQEKMILVEIDSYDNGEIGCYASNKHFVSNFGINSSRISQIIQSLQRKNYITINYEYNGKEIVKRYLHINRPPYPPKEGMLKNNIGMLKNEMGVCQFDKGGYVKKLKDNNTNINNTNINNKKERKKEDIKITVEDIDLSNNSQNQQVDKATSGFQETNALKEYIKCLKKEIEMLKKERKKETNYDKIINSMVEDEEVKNSIYEFIKMRKLIKKPMTDRALTMLINKLEKLSSDKDIQIKILEKSILKNWTDIYELKGDNNDGYIRKCSNDDGSEYAEFV